MPTFTTEKFLNCLRASNVVPHDQVAQIVEQVRTDDAKVLAVEFIRRKLLTEWQAKSLLTGRKRLSLGNYQLLKRLNKNEYGDRFLARHLQLDRTVEIQILPPEVKDDKASLDLFIQNASRASTIDHPNLVHVYDLDHESGRYYLVEEHIDGQPLVDCIDELSMVQTINLIRQAFSGLLNAHQNKVVHGQVSIADFLVNSDRQLKISNLALSPNSSETSEEFSLFDLHAAAAIGKEILAYKDDAASATTVAEIAPILESICSMTESGQIGTPLEQLDQWLRENDPAALPSSNAGATVVAKRRKPATEESEAEETGELSSAVSVFGQRPKLVIGIATAAGLIILGLTVWLAYSFSTNNSRNTVKNNQKDTVQQRETAATKPVEKPEPVKEDGNSKPDIDMEAFVANLDGDPEFTPVKKEFELDPDKNKTALAVEPTVKEQQSAANPTETAPTPKATAPLGSAPVGTANDPMGRNSITGNPADSNSAPLTDNDNPPIVVATKPMSADSAGPDDAANADAAAQPERQFDKLSEAVDLPDDLANTQPIQLGEIDLPRNYLLGVELITGKPISRAKLTFGLQRDETNKQKWDIHFRRRPTDEPIVIATLNFVDKNFSFAWSADAAANEQANFLRNCLLKIQGKRKSVFLSLRKPVAISGLSISNESTSVKVDAELGWLPHPDFLKIEVQRVQDEELQEMIVEPQLIQRKSPARIFFAREPTYRFGWIEIGAEARKKLSFDMDLKLVTSPTSKPKNAKFKDLQTFANNIKASAEQSRKQVEGLKEAQKPANVTWDNFNAYKKEVEATNAILQKQSLVAINLEKGISSMLDKPIPLSVYFELNGVRVEIANSK